MSENYGFDVLAELSKYKSIVTHIDRLTDEKSLPELLDRAKAVFIHSSFPTDDLKSRICYLAEKKGLPLVIFSGNEPATIWDKENANIIRLMKKDRFYHSLIPFLEYYHSNTQEKVELTKLVFGEKYEIERSKVIQDRLAFFLAEKINGFNYESDFIYGSQEYKYIYELFYFLYPEHHEHEFSKFDEQACKKQNDAESFFGLLKDLILKIIEKYG